LSEQLLGVVVLGLGELERDFLFCEKKKTGERLSQTSWLANNGE